MYTIARRVLTDNFIDRVFRRRLTFAVGFVVLLLLALSLPRIPHTLRASIDDDACIFAPLAAFLWIVSDLIATRRSVVKETRRAWAIRLSCTFLALASLGDFLGEALWWYYEQVLKTSPFPSLADAAYLTEYPFLLTAILLMPARPMTPALRLRVLLDSLMVMACVVTFSWYFILGPTLLTAHGAALGTFLSAGYPIGDLVVLGCVLMLFAQERRVVSGSAAVMLACGLLSVVIADIVFAYQTLKGTYGTGEVVDIFWPIGYFLIGLSATVVRRQSPESLIGDDEERQSFKAERGGRQSIVRSLAPYALLPVLGALVVYCVRSQGAVALENGVYAGAALLVVLVLFRQIVAIVDNAQLNRQLQIAYGELQSAQEALALKNHSLALANTRLESLAMTDGMTGLINHRVFYERLGEACARASRYAAPFSLMLIDVDRFKSYNDTYGHPAGDAILKAVAHLLEQGARETDIVARYGGEEFAMLMPMNDLEGARMTAERIRASIETHSFEHRTITVSIGVSAFASERDTPEDLVSSADRALYDAKGAGRNRVVVSARTDGPDPRETASTPSMMRGN